MKWDSPIVLALAGTLAIHLILGVVLDAIEVLNPLVLDPPPPHVTMVDVEVRATPAVAKREVPREVAKEERPTKVVRTVRRAQVASTEPEKQIDVPKTETVAASGGEQVFQMEDIAPAANGVPVEKGKKTGTGSGMGSGTGSGTGSGSGSGSGTGPVSVATIKTMPKARGDYGYVGGAYPAEARRLGIEGDLHVRVVVDAQGRVVEAKLLDSLGHGLDELALQRAKVMEFDPAVDTSGRTVTAQLVWTFHMTLPK